MGSSILKTQTIIMVLSVLFLIVCTVAEEENRNGFCYDPQPQPKSDCDAQKCSDKCVFMGYIRGLCKLIYPPTPYAVCVCEKPCTSSEVNETNL
ncbi:unnamed protein product [Lactuca saligna]|uniref:Defensin-like protein n=1 Tax=Lactuca saligna TaxID=75948 RepID=A0AA35ZE54_LACSI|nr:unnamed protein product [Lactuca saligna]